MARLPAARLELEVEQSCQTGRSTPRRRCRTRHASRTAPVEGTNLVDMRQDAFTVKWGQREAQNGGRVHEIGLWQHRMQEHAGRYRP